jgi:hypothetical protein
VLTDGRTWSVYLPSGSGDYTERRVYLLDLEERTSDESAERLTRYLRRDDVVSEEAFRRAQLDYQRSRQRREAREAIPSAWRALVEAGDARLVDAVAAEVETRSGYRPESADVYGFLSELVQPAQLVPKPLPKGAKPSSPPGSETKAKSDGSLAAPPRPVGVESQMPRNGVIPEGTELRVTYKGRVFSGRFERGQIVVNGQSYKSPSAAGSAVTGTSVNGWIFWECRLPGEVGWKVLDTLRGSR